MALMDKILIIEDNRDVSNLLKETLENSGYEVDSAFDGIEGMKKINAGGIELVILDIMLPYKSGDVVLKEMRSFTDIPVMVISAKDMVGTRIDMIKAGEKQLEVYEMINYMAENLINSEDSIISVLNKEIVDGKIMIDKSLIWPAFNFKSESDEDEIKKAELLLDSVIHMLKKIGTEIVAEGVETKEMAEYLSAAGVDHLQGYYYSKPVDADKFMELLMNLFTLA